MKTTKTLMNEMLAEAARTLSATLNAELAANPLFISPNFAEELIRNEECNAEHPLFIPKTDEECIAEQLLCEDYMEHEFLEARDRHLTFLEEWFALPGHEAQAARWLAR